MSNDKQILFSHRKVLTRTSKIAKELQSVISSDVVLLDNQGQIFPPPSKDLKNDGDGRFGNDLIQRIKHLKGLTCDKEKRFWVYPIWLKQPIYEKEDERYEKWVKEYFVGAIYIDRISETELEKIALLIPFIQIFLDETVDLIHILSGTIDTWLKDQTLLRNLYDFTEKFGKIDNIDDLIELVLEVIVKKLNPEYACILLFKEDSDDLDMTKIYSSKFSSHLDFFERLNISRGSSLYRISKDGDADIYNDKEKLADMDIQAMNMLAAPIRTMDKPKGVICVFNKMAGKVTDTEMLAHNPEKWYKDFYSDDRGFLVAIATSAGVAISRQEAWKEMAFRAAHKIGNALFGMRGNVSWLKIVIDAEPIDENEIRETSGKIEKGLNNANSMIREFKAYYKFDKLEMTENDINHVIEDSVFDIEKSTGDDIKFNKKYGAKLPRINIDRTQFSSCIHELIENACNAMAYSGMITIDTHIAFDDEKISIDLPLHIPYLSVVISDTGQGVSEKNKKNIFQPFFSTTAKGSGLGLAIAKKCIEAHQGTIIENGKEGGGASFLVALPVLSK